MSTLQCPFWHRAAPGFCKKNTSQESKKTMGLPAFYDLGSLVAISIGTPVDVSHLETLACMVGGTFVGTVSIEASFDGGATFVAIPGLSGLTVPTALAVPFMAQQIRANCTAYTSGTLECRASGKDLD